MPLRPPPHTEYASESAAPAVYPERVRAIKVRAGQRRPVTPGYCLKRTMLFETRFALLRCVRLLLAASLPLAATCLGAQTSSSSQTGTTAAPGTAPMRARATAQRISPTRVATYDDKFELYGGISLMNGQAGQNLPKRYNMGGGEVMGTYWLGPRLGVAGDYRIGAGTTDIFPTPFFAPGTRLLVMQNIFSGGVNYRGPKGRYAAIDFHALFGASRGSFDHSLTTYPNRPAALTNGLVGVYNNGTTPWGAVGGSIDFNATPKLAVRLSPDLTFEHFGTETREFFAISGGVVYRFGKRTR